MQRPDAGRQVTDDAINDAVDAAASEGCAVEGLQVSVYRFPTDTPESDGTLSWENTTLVVVETSAAGKSGLGYTYAHRAAGEIIDSVFKNIVVGSRLFEHLSTWERLRDRSRNLGRPGLVSMAISAVDTALWDLKARVLKLPLAALLGPLRSSVSAYGSGGFTSYSEERLGRQLAAWVDGGFQAVKMKVGSDPARDVERVRAARAAIGSQPRLFIDANGAYGVKQALALAAQFRRLGVVWFEEPVSMDDEAGLRFIKEHAPSGMEVVAGEYGFDLTDFARLLRSRSVDVLQADVTRCQGITGFLRVAALCEAMQIALSTHCAPALNLHPACAAPRLRNLEWFHDHTRIEELAFEGVPRPRGGTLKPDLSARGHGLTLKRADLQRYRL